MSASTHPGKILKNDAFSLSLSLGSSIREQRAPLKSLFIERKKMYYRNNLKYIRQRAKFKILPTYGASACCHIGLDRRQLGLVGEKGQIAKHTKTKKMVVPSGN